MTTPNDAPCPTSELVKRLHSESNAPGVYAGGRILLREAAASLQSLEDDNTHFRAAYNNTVGSLNEAEGRAEDLEARNKELEGVLDVALDTIILPHLFDKDSLRIVAAKIRAALHPATKTGET